MKLLVTGFEPFGEEMVNPSELALRRLMAEGVADVELSCLVLPVVRFRAVDLAISAIERERPDAVIMLGEAGGRTAITPERVAIGVDDYRRPDNGGNWPEDEEIVPDGPAAYMSTLPVKAMVARMCAASVPAAVSNTAGTYLCNHLTYGVAHYIARRRLPVCAGFVHLPYLPEQALTKSPVPPSMALETVMHGLHAALAAVVEVLPARSASPALAGV